MKFEFDLNNINARILKETINYLNRIADIYDFQEKEVIELEKRDDDFEKTQAHIIDKNDNVIDNEEFNPVEIFKNQQEKLKNEAWQSVKPLAAVNELDSEGFPWDARIHSSTRNKTKSGEWRLLRGAEAQLVQKVRQEYQSKNMAPPSQPVPGEIVQAVIPAVNQVAEKPINKSTTFIEAMPKISHAIASGIVTREELLTILNDIGLDSVQSLAKNEDKIPYVLETIGVQA